MTKRNICLYGDAVLKQKAAAIENFDEKTAEMVQDLSDTMYGSGNGVGLAAPQIGVSRRAFVMDVDYLKEEGNGKRHLQVFLNPEITWESEEDVAYSEGCLSLPGIEGEVYRPEKIRLRWQDEKGKVHEEDFEDFPARCVQHELDHLDGKVFVDRMPFVRRQLLAGKLGRLKKISRSGEALPV